MVELARRGPHGDPMRIRDIADANAIPPRFLVQILLQLKVAGLVESLRGASGGYRLAKPPETITVADILDVAEGSGSVRSASCDEPTPLAALRCVWREARDAARRVVSGVTLAELRDRTQPSDEHMYYI